MWMLCLGLLVLNQACSVETACIPGKQYCGNSDHLHQITFHGNTQDAEAIFVCLEDGQNATWNASCGGGLQCYHGCSNGEVHCRQPCEINKLYCGHQLAQMTGWSRSVVSYRSNTIFKCALMPHTNMVNETALQTCHLGCQAGRRRPSCAKCESGRRYCSSELVDDITIRKNSVYLCSGSGNKMVLVEECRSCEQGHCCDEDSLFCGSELPSTSSTDYLPEGLYNCSNGNFTLHMRCAAGCIAQQPQSHCSCVPSVFYCGEQLRVLGYRHIRDSFTYICINETTLSVPIQVNYCEYGCAQGRCCEWNSFFCGSELNLRENNYLPKALYKCSGGTFKLQMRCATSCIAQEPRSYCECVPSASYCGYELQNLGYSSSIYKYVSGIYVCKNETTLLAQDHHYCFSPSVCMQGQCWANDNLFCGSELPSYHASNYFRDSLYNCVYGRCELRQRCAAGCRAQKPQSHCACVPSATYCGQELESLGYQYMVASNIYICKTDTTFSVQFLDYCGNHQCVQGHCCNSDSLFCGSELMRFRNNTYLPQGLYKCSNGSFMLHMRCATGCISQQPRSHCASLQCQPSVYYCGHELQSLGFHDIDAHSIYICTDKTTLPVIKEQNCLPHHCSSAGYVHCSHSCTAGSRYCGYEDAVQEHQGFANPMDNALYMCTEEHYFVYQETCHRDCLHTDTSSECKPSRIDNLNCGVVDLVGLELHVSGGHVATRTNWPFIVSVQSRLEHMCGGILIDNSWVLTAAHCFEKKPSQIVHGQHNLVNATSTEFIVNISSIVQHPSYNKRLLRSGDIGLIKLDKSVVYGRLTRPACLPVMNVSLEAGTSCMVAGWGSVSNDKKNSKSLLEGFVTVLPNSVCEGHFFGRGNDGRDYTFDREAMICAGRSNITDVLPCGGDSGGPLVCQRDDSKWAVYGLVSYGLRDACNSTVLAPVTFVKVAPFIEWIMDTVDQ